LAWWSTKTFSRPAGSLPGRSAAAAACSAPSLRVFQHWDDGRGPVPITAEREFSPSGSPEGAPGLDRHPRAEPPQARPGRAGDGPQRARDLPEARLPEVAARVAEVRGVGHVEGVDPQ